MKTETSILLPAASVDLFLKDKETIESARALQNDWRFARVKINVHEGDVEDAIRTYTQKPSPEIIMVETDTTGDSFIGRLGDLSGNCNENTSAIVIGPVNDVNLYRSLTAMGVSDYLVRPVPQDTLGEVIAQSLIEKLGAAGSRLIAMIGAKGGTGVSSLAQIMAWSSSENLGQKTLLLDAAGAWSSLAVGMGFEPVASTTEAIKAAVGNDQDSIRRMIYQANEKLFVLATGTEPLLDISAQIAQFEEILNIAMASYPVVIVDLSGATPSLKKIILTRAHETIIVSTPTLSSLRSARSLLQEVRNLHGGHDINTDLLINMAGIAPGKEVSRSDIKSALDIEPYAYIPFDAKLFMGSEHEGKRISTDKAGQDIIQQILPLLKKMISRDTSMVETPATEGILGSLLGKIKKK